MGNLLEHFVRAAREHKTPERQPDVLDAPVQAILDMIQSMIGAIPEGVRGQNLNPLPQPQRMITGREGGGTTMEDILQLLAPQSRSDLMESIVPVPVTNLGFTRGLLRDISRTRTPQESAKHIKNVALHGPINERALSSIGDEAMVARKRMPQIDVTPEDLEDAAEDVAEELAGQVAFLRLAERGEPVGNMDFPELGGLVPVEAFVRGPGQSTVVDDMIDRIKSGRMQGSVDEFENLGPGRDMQRGVPSFENDLGPIGPSDVEAGLALSRDFRDPAIIPDNELMLIGQRGKRALSNQAPENFVFGEPRINNELEFVDEFFETAPGMSIGLVRPDRRSMALGDDPAGMSVTSDSAFADLIEFLKTP